MLKRSTRLPQKNKARKLFPSHLKECIVKNVLEITYKIRFKPIDDILEVEEDILLRAIDTDKNEACIVTLSSLLDEKQVSGSFSRACEHVCVVGSKGSGKTTVLLKFIRHALQGNIPQIDPSDNIIHLLRCHDFDSKKKMTLIEFLFNDIKDDVTCEDVYAGFDWMCRNPTKLTFVIDKIPYSIKPAPQIGVHELATPSTILYNLLYGQIFIGCGILSSCDDEILHPDTENIIPVEKYVTVCGFSPAGITRIALKYLGKDMFYRSFVHFKNTSPYLLTLCEHPTILILTLASLKNNDDVESTFLPKGLSGVLLRLLVQLIKKYDHVSEEIAGIINKLKHVSYHVTKERGNVLKTKDLELVECSTEDLKKCRVPNTNIELFVKASQDDENEFECIHPILLHALSALYIAELDFDRFEPQLLHIVSDNNYRFILRYLSGFLLDDQLFDLSLNLFEPGSARYIQITNNRERKRELLRGHIKSEIIEIEEKFDLAERFNILHVACESGGELKSEIFHNFDNFCVSPFGCASLTTADMCALATCICWRVQFTHLDMTDCYVPICLIKTLHKSMASINSCAKIGVFSMNYEYSIRKATVDDAIALSHFLIYITEKCDLRGWHFNQENESCIQNKLNKLELFRLVVLINKGDTLVAQSTWKDIAEEDVGSGGGVIELNDCGIDFPKGTFDETIRVTMEMTNIAPAYPEGYLILSPTINVLHKSSLLKPVLVDVRPWCSNLNGDMEILDVDILHLEDDDDTWTNIKTMALGDEKTVQFECKTFSSILVAIKKIFAPRLIYPMTGQLYVKGNLWCVAFCIDHRSTIKQTDESLEKGGFRAVFLPFNTINSRLGNEIEVKLNVIDLEDFYFDIKEAGKPAIQISRQFVKQPRFHRSTFNLRRRSRGKGSYSIEIGFQILLDGKVVDSEEFYYDVTISGAGGPKRIEDYFQNELLPRFADITEFRKFAISGEGFSLSAQKMSEIREDSKNMYDQQLRMFLCWKTTQGKRATSEYLRELVEKYFDRIPYATKNEQIQLDDLFDETISEIGQHLEWMEFASSDSGLRLKKEYINKIKGTQEQLTRPQKKQILEEWRKNEGDSASVKRFKEVRDEFDKSRT